MPHSRSWSSDSTSIFKQNRPSKSTKRSSQIFHHAERRPSPLFGRAATSSSASSTMDPLDQIRHKVPFVGVVSTYGDTPRDIFLSAIFNPALRSSPAPENHSYTSVMLDHHAWRCWVGQVVHPLAQPDHFEGQLKQLDVLIIMYSSQSRNSLESVARICERYVDVTAPSTASISPKDKNPPIPVIVATTTTAGPVRPIINDHGVDIAEGIALARKYNGRFVELSSFSDAATIQKPIEAAVAAWVKNNTNVELLPNNPAMRASLSTDDSVAPPPPSSHLGFPERPSSFTSTSRRGSSRNSNDGRDEFMSTYNIGSGSGSGGRTSNIERSWNKDLGSLPEDAIGASAARPEFPGRLESTGNPRSPTSRHSTITDEPEGMPGMEKRPTQIRRKSARLSRILNAFKRHVNVGSGPSK